MGIFKNKNKIEATKMKYLRTVKGVTRGWWRHLQKIGSLGYFKLVVCVSTSYKSTVESQLSIIHGT